MAPEDNQKILLASSAGYGFICPSNELIARNRNGKAIINLPDNATVLPPLTLTSDKDLLLAITTSGRMILFPVNDLPELTKGKGNKIVSLAKTEDGVVDALSYMMLITDKTTLTLYVGKRKLTLYPKDLQKFRTERGRKGTLLPRGLQKIDRIEVNEQSQSTNH